MSKIQTNRILIVDLEATCWEDKQYQKEHSEILEIGVVELDLEKRIISKKASYLIPPVKSKISEFCTNLTGITLNTKGDWVSLQKASKLIRKNFSPTNIYWSSWGNGDFEFLKQQCVKFNAVYPFGKNHLDISDLYKLSKGRNKNIGLKKVVDEYGLKFHGKQHRALDDAINTAAILLKILQ